MKFLSMSACATLMIGVCGGGCTLQTDESRTVEDIAAEEAAIGEAGCATATPDRTALGHPTDIQTPLTYSNASCYKAFVVQVNQWDQSFGKTMQVRWNSLIPTEQAACESAWLRADIYRLQSGTFQPFGGSSTNGVWSGSSCRIPLLTVGPFLPPGGSTPHTFKLALSARRSSASSAATRRLILDTPFPD